MTDDNVDSKLDDMLGSAINQLTYVQRARGMQHRTTVLACLKDVEECHRRQRELIKAIRKQLKAQS